LPVITPLLVRDCEELVGELVVEGLVGLRDVLLPVVIPLLVADCEELVEELLEEIWVGLRDV
jgi:hypothetical protein